MCQRQAIGAIQQDSTWYKEIYVQQRLDLNYIHQYIREVESHPSPSIS
jgi:hypothetical protein